MVPEVEKRVPRREGAGGGAAIPYGAHHLLSYKKGQTNLTTSAVGKWPGKEMKEWRFHTKNSFEPREISIHRPFGRKLYSFGTNPSIPFIFQIPAQCRGRPCTARYF